ncbi:MAG: DUF4340 domain-containing protein [Treponemataceae bacterium]|nr:DUF4340 domain-containing protein [Treponemataceae bacterium]
MGRKGDFALPVAAAALAVLYGASFLPGLGGRYVERPSETAVLNRKYAASVSRVMLEQADGRLVLSKDAEAGVWRGSDGTSEFPADAERMARFLERLQAVRTWCRVADGPGAAAEFGLSEEERFTLSYWTDGDAGAPASLFIGASDFSKTMRFVQAGGDAAVYRMEVDFDGFLHTEPRYWYDPYLVPRNLFSPASGTIARISVAADGRTFSVLDAPRLSELRHGALCPSLPEGGAVLSLAVEVAAGGTVFLAVHPHPSGDFAVSCRAAPDWNYAVFISSWTYGKLREILGIQ